MGSISRSEFGILPVLLAAILFVTAGCSGIAVTDSDTKPDLQFDLVDPADGVEYSAREHGTTVAGAGVYIADVDNDRRPDLLLLGGAPEDEGLQRPGLYVRGDDGYERSSALPDGLSERGEVLAAHFFDYDNDGWEDLVLLYRGGDSLFLENREGTFVERSITLSFPERLPSDDLETGMSDPEMVPMGATSADYDGDGDLDLFVFQNGDWQEAKPMAYKHPNRTIEADNGNANYLFENTEGGFARVSPMESGIRGEHWTLAASFVDLTGDGAPDIHVANDFGADVVYVNQRDGSFERLELGPETDRNAMSSEIADVNRDGRPDVFVTNIFLGSDGLTEFGHTYRRNVINNGMGNNMLVNRGNGSFDDLAGEYNVKRGGWGWAAAITDFDNDGHLDLVHAVQRNDAEFRQRAFENGDPPAYFQSPALWTGNDSAFTPRNASDHGFEPSNARGLATMDFDRDGDRDLLIAEWGDGNYQLYENVGADGRWAQFALEGNASQTPIGARVYVTVNGTTGMQLHNAKADYLSQDSRVLHFGLGDAERIDRLRVVWPDGSEHVYRDLETDRLYVVSIDGEIERHASE